MPDEVVDLVDDEQGNNGNSSRSRVRLREAGSEPQVLKRVRPNEAQDEAAEARDDSDEFTRNFSMEEVRPGRLNYLTVGGQLSKSLTNDLVKLLKSGQLQSLELDAVLENVHADPLAKELTRNTTLKTLRVKSLSGSAFRLVDFCTALEKNKGISHLDWRVDVNAAFLQVLRKKNESIAILTLKVPRSTSPHYEELISILRAWPKIFTLVLKGSLEDRQNMVKRLNAPRNAAISVLQNNS